MRNALATPVTTVAALLRAGEGAGRPRSQARRVIPVCGVNENEVATANETGRHVNVIAWLAVILGSASRILACEACDPTGHLGVAVVVEENKIRTGIYVYDPSGPVTADVGVQVWSGGHFQENPLDPFWTDDPCYGSTVDGGLPPGSEVGFNILSDLLYWDGHGPTSFGPVPDGEQLRVKYGFMTRHAGTGTGCVAGFNFQTVPSDGAFHRHINYFLLGSDGNSIPADQDGIQAADGVYLLEIELTSTAGVASSDPIWLVFRNFPASDPLAGVKHCMALLYVAHEIAHDRPPADLDFDRDVDSDDLDRFEACATGPDIPYTQDCCGEADLDLDGDVDQSDFGVMQRCLSAEAVTTGLACAN